MFEKFSLRDNQILLKESVINHELFVLGEFYLQALAERQKAQGKVKFEQLPAHSKV